MDQLKYSLLFVGCQIRLFRPSDGTILLEGEIQKMEAAPGSRRTAKNYAGPVFLQQQVFLLQQEGTEPHSFQFSAVGPDALKRKAHWPVTTLCKLECLHRAPDSESMCMHNSTVLHQECMIELVTNAGLEKKSQGLRQRIHGSFSGPGALLSSVSLQWRAHCLHYILTYPGEPCIDNIRREEVERHLQGLWDSQDPAASFKQHFPESKFTVFHTLKEGILCMEMEEGGRVIEGCKKVYCEVREEMKGRIRTMSHKKLLPTLSQKINYDRNLELQRREQLWSLERLKFLREFVQRTLHGSRVLSFRTCAASQVW